MDEIARIGRAHDVVICNVFHAGDGNLHPNLCFDSRDAGQSARVARASREIMEACVAAGGTITGEHGVGQDKRDYMPLIFSAESLQMMCDVRGVFDRERRANPGKVIPLRSCREWRAGGLA
ncbi:MAG: FAD-binding oxidoreductase, partial [Gemmatimonadales bacterium]|nr:FAD-binding oxidoreductase [Gemmatimonadales bacterium]